MEYNTRRLGTVVTTLNILSIIVVVVIVIIICCLYLHAFSMPHFEKSSVSC